MRVRVRTVAGSFVTQCDGFGTADDGTFVASYGDLVTGEIMPGALLGVDVLSPSGMERRAVHAVEPSPPLFTGPIEVVNVPPVVPEGIGDPAEVQTVTLAGPSADDAFAGRED